MDNKRLFKFLHKDISEIEELFAEKGTDGFDELEMEFLRTRFQGAKHIIQLLSEQDIPTKRVVVSTSIASQRADEAVEKTTKSGVVAQETLSTDEQESLAALSDFEEELKQEEIKPEPVVPADNSEVSEETQITSTEGENAVTNEQEKGQVSEAYEQEEEATAINSNAEEEKEEIVDADEEMKPVEVSSRIGDRVIKEKSVNDLLSGNDDKKLEYKISNSPVKSIQTAIGINDRYQYIRELFDGNAETYTKTVVELDSFGNIQQAVAYLQENFKWKKNETSLKFVNLVKRRFPDG